MQLSTVKAILECRISSSESESSINIGKKHSYREEDIDYLNHLTTEMENFDPDGQDEDEI